MYGFSVPENHRYMIFLLHFWLAEGTKLLHFCLADSTIHDAYVTFPLATIVYTRTQMGDLLLEDFILTTTSKGS